MLSPALQHGGHDWFLGATRLLSRKGAIGHTRPTRLLRPVQSAGGRCADILYPQGPPSHRCVSWTARSPSPPLSPASHRGPAPPMTPPTSRRRPRRSLPPTASAATA